jgi:hypothetical protein
MDRTRIDLPLNGTLIHESPGFSWRSKTAASGQKGGPELEWLILNTRRLRQKENLNWDGD